MRSTQLEMLRSPARRHPYYWARFISIGAWGPIELTSEGEEENAQAGTKAEVSDLLLRYLAKEQGH